MTMSTSALQAPAGCPPMTTPASRGFLKMEGLKKVSDRLIVLMKEMVKTQWGLRAVYPPEGTKFVCSKKRHYRVVNKSLRRVRMNPGDVRDSK